MVAIHEGEPRIRGGLDPRRTVDRRPHVRHALRGTYRQQSWRCAVGPGPFRVRRCPSVPEVTMLQPKVAKLGLFAFVVLSIGVVVGRFLL